MGQTTYECTRCGSEFSTTAIHTEIVRRDFVEVPQPSCIERLCRECWEAYVADFLDKDFESLLRRYDATD